MTKQSKFKPGALVRLSLQFYNSNVQSARSIGIILCKAAMLNKHPGWKIHWFNNFSPDYRYYEKMLDLVE